MKKNFLFSFFVIISYSSILDAYWDGNPYGAPRYLIIFNIFKKRSSTKIYFVCAFWIFHLEDMWLSMYLFITHVVDHFSVWSNYLGKETKMNSERKASIIYLSGTTIRKNDGFTFWRWGWGLVGFCLVRCTLFSHVQYFNHTKQLIIVLIVLSAWFIEREARRCE